MRRCHPSSVFDPFLSRSSRVVLSAFGSAKQHGRWIQVRGRTCIRQHEREKTKKIFSLSFDYRCFDPDAPPLPSIHPSFSQVSKVRYFFFSGSAKKNGMRRGRAGIQRHEKERKTKKIFFLLLIIFRKSYPLSLRIGCLLPHGSAIPLHPTLPYPDSSCLLGRSEIEKVNREKMASEKNRERERGPFSCPFFSQLIGEVPFLFFDRRIRQRKKNGMREVG
jgi:hypothetical protein